MKSKTITNTVIFIGSFLVAMLVIGIVVLYSVIIASWLAR